MLSLIFKWYNFIWGSISRLASFSKIMHFVMKTSCIPRQISIERVFRGKVVARVARWHVKTSIDAPNVQSTRDLHRKSSKKLRKNHYYFDVWRFDASITRKSASTNNPGCDAVLCKSGKLHDFHVIFYRTQPELLSSLQSCKIADKPLFK